MNWIGKRYQVIIEGTRHINGARFRLMFCGTILKAETDVSIYEVLHNLVDAIFEQLKDEMQYPDAIQITIFPPGQGG